MLTLAEVKAGDIADSIGVCANGDQFRNYVNKATRMLLNRDAGEGAWWGTVERIQICSYNGCVTWPRFVDSVLALKKNGQPLELKNQWYSFLPLTRLDWNCGGFSWSGGRCGGSLRAVNEAEVPVESQIPCGSDRYIRVYPSVQEDVSKTTTIYGIDANGQEILTQRDDGTWQPGVELTLAIPFVVTPFKIREVTRITQSVCQGVVRYYQYDADLDLLYDLVTVSPGQTTPSFRRSRIPQLCGCSTTTCNGLVRLEAIVKLAYVPAVLDDDLVLISNEDALRDMMQSIRWADNGDKEQSAKFELSAIHELNLEASRKFPKEQTPMELNPFGRGLPVNYGVGIIV